MFLRTTGPAVTTEVLVEGGAFFEGPRWRDGRLWFADMHAREIRTVDLDGRCRLVAQLSDRPSGLGWMPDGRLLVVSMSERKLLEMDSWSLSVRADLSPLAEHECNDMVVDRHGRAYIGHFGFDHFAHRGFRFASLLAVEPDGSVRVVADRLRFPNGTVITDDGRTLVVAESYGRRLTAFDIERDGSLTGRRLWADLGMAPDGICLDREGCVWVASPTHRACVRFREGGEVLERIPLDGKGIACMLGGPDRRTLFILTSRTTDATKAVALRSARILAARVEVPGAGLP